MSQYTITPIVVGRCESPEPRLLYLGDPEKTIPTIFTFFLLRGDGRNVLVDVGFTAEVCARYMPDVDQAPDEDPFLQLDALGVEPDDVDEVVLTHAHFDHLSPTVNEFRNARVYLQRSEFEFVTDPPHPWFGEMVDMQTLEALAAEGEPRFNLLEGEREFLPGIRSVTTPGHTAGHQSLLVECERGAVCLAGDASFTYRNVEEDIGPGFNCNLIEALQSLEKLRQLARGGTLILPGHDPQMLHRLSGAG